MRLTVFADSTFHLYNLLLRQLHQSVNRSLKKHAIETDSTVAGHFIQDQSIFNLIAQHLKT